MAGRYDSNIMNTRWVMCLATEQQATAQVVSKASSWKECVMATDEPGTNLELRALADAYRMGRIEDREYRWRRRHVLNELRCSLDVTARRPTLGEDQDSVTVADASMEFSGRRIRMRRVFHPQIRWLFFVTLLAVCAAVALMLGLGLLS